MTFGENMDSNKKTQQEARAKLREYFLRAIHDLSGEPCRIMTYEQNWLEAKFVNLNANASEIFVHDLETPACVTIPAALLRAPDVLAVQFDKTIQLP